LKGFWVETFSRTCRLFGTHHFQPETEVFMKQTTEKVEKKKYGFRIRPEVNELIETHKYMNGDDRSAFVTEAIRRYCADIDGEKNCDILVDRITSNVRAMTRNDMNRICHAMFKIAVELGMHNYLLAAGYVELDDEEIRNVRNRSIDRVRRTHGYITFEDAVEEERDFGTDE
jgi:hypothetical protein